MTDRERANLGIDELAYDGAGLIPAVVQQHGTGEVLMVAYMNRESLAETIATGKTWFWSRSRQKFWMKGESSGHVQDVLEIRYDCDADCLLVLVDQHGAACHTMERSCFYRTLFEGAGFETDESESESGKTAADVGEPAASDETVRAAAAGTGPAPVTSGSDLGAVLDELAAVLESRKREMPEDSYTAQLLGGPEDALLKKIGEEATEVVMAAKDHDAGQLRYEIGDLVYHLLVVMTREGLTLGDIADELGSRRR